MTAFSMLMTVHVTPSNTFENANLEELFDDSGTASFGIRSYLSNHFQAIVSVENESKARNLGFI